MDVKQSKLWALQSAIRFELRPFQRIAATLAGTALAPLVPERCDGLLTRAVARSFLIALPQRQRLVASRIAEHLGIDDPDVNAEASRDYWLQRVETRWGQARGISRAGWAPPVELQGGEHLTEALAAGRGAILWRVSSHSAIPLNQSLADHGFAPVHLSQALHLTIDRNNRLWKMVAPRVALILRRGEVAPLAERVELGDRGASAAMKRLIIVLGENRVVTIVGDLSTGRKTHSVKVNRNQLQLANGGARLAVRTGAALLPVTLSRTGPLRYRVDIGKPLTPPIGADTDEAVASLIEQFAEILAEWIREDPAQWPKWRFTLS